MSYEVANDSISLGQFASNMGYSNLVKAAKHRGYTALEAFFAEGRTRDVGAVVRDLQVFIQHTHDSDIVSTATQLMHLVTGQKIAVITDGIT